MGALQKIFKKYSAQGDSLGAKSMNLKEWTLFNKEFKLVDARYDQRAMTSAFHKAQDDGSDSTDDEGASASSSSGRISSGSSAHSNAEMIYPEFLEAIVTVACYKSPDPFMTIDKKTSQ